MQEPDPFDSLAVVGKHESMNTVTHAAVRRDIARFQQALQYFPVGSRARAEQLAAAWRFLDAQLYHHHHSEETIFWPALRKLDVDEALVGDLGGEHDRMAEAMTRTGAAMSALSSNPGQEQLDEASAAFAELDESVETHFEHEERDLEPAMVQLANTPELKQAQVAVRKTQSLPSAGAFLSWLLDDADPDARAYVDRALPKPLVVALTRVFGRSYRRVATAWS